MTHKGRPKDLKIAKNRIHSVVLDREAEFYYRKIGNMEDRGWFNRFVNNAIKTTFQKDMEEKYLKYKLLEAQKNRDEEEKKIRQLADRIAFKNKVLSKSMQLRFEKYNERKNN